MDKRAIVILIVIFLLNPFLGMVVIVYYKMITNKRERESDFLLFVFITTYACLLQSTRIWNVNLPSDWNGMSTIYYFREAGNTPFFKYLFSIKKEPVWRLLNYIGYYLTDGTLYTFLNGIAIFTIFLTCTSIYIYWKKTQTDPITLIASLALIVFFTEYFDQLNNLIRQYFSLSIIIYIYVRKITSNKTNWWLLIVAGLIHTFSFLFLFLFMIKPLYKKIDKKQLVKIGIIVLGIIVILNNMSLFQNLFIRIRFLSYGWNRLVTASHPNDHNFLSVSVVYMNAIFLIFISILMNYTRNDNRHLVFFTNILMVTMILSISIAKIAPEIMGRIYVSRFYLFPFVLPYFMMHKKSIHYIYVYGIFFFFFIRFLFIFNMIRGGGFFPHINNLLTYSIFNFVL